MRSRIQPPTLTLALFVVLMTVALSAAKAGAAEPTLYELPKADHAVSLAPGAGGTLWFEPVFGSEAEKPEDPTLGRIGDDGTVTQVPMPTLTGGPVAGPQNEVWVPGTEVDAAGEDVPLVGLISDSGTIAKSLSLGAGSGEIRHVAVGSDAVWVALGKSGAREWIDRVSIATGTARREVVARPDCYVSAMAVAADRTLWFAEGCEEETSEGWGPGRSSIGHATPGGKLDRLRVPHRAAPGSLALGRDGTVWFGAVRWNLVGGEIGRIDRGGSLTEHRVPNGLVNSIAAGRNGRLWFQSSFGGEIHRALDWIDASGKVGKPICADPTCGLEPIDLAAAPDGSLWYSLWRPHSIGGGGVAQILEGEEIENEAGFVGHLVP